MRYSTKIALMLCFFCVAAALAQNEKLRFGIGGSASYHRINDRIHGDGSDNFDFGYGYSIGFLTQFSLTEMISLNPEIHFAGRGYSSERPFDFSSYQAQHGRLVSVSEFLINIPVMCRFTFKNFPYVETGLHLAIPFNSKIEYSKEGGWFDPINFDKRAGVDFGMIFGSGAKLTDAFILGARYIMNFNKMADLGDGYVYEHVFGVGAYVGYMF